MKKPFFPMFVDLSEKRIVIVGGGKVAARRACTLAAFASDILVAAPEAEQEIRQLEQDGVLQWYRGTYHESLLDTADIVLAATNDAALNEEVARCCRKRGILVNTSHKKELCDFYFPAVAIQGNVVAGITASGQDHAKARKEAGKIRLALKDLEKEDISINE